MTPAWLGRSDCKQSVTGEAMAQCPIMPSRMKWVDGIGYKVTKNKCRTCGSEFVAAFERPQIPAKKVG